MKCKDIKLEISKQLFNSLVAKNISSSEKLAMKKENETITINDNCET